MGPDQPRQTHGRLDVDGEDIVEVLVARFDHGLAAKDASVMDDRVDSSKMAVRRGHPGRFTCRIPRIEGRPMTTIRSILRQRRHRLACPRRHSPAMR
ncbi:hypothetical protein G6F22_016116 [Rhizopus arrhizus]|nr:hypothetical protein G6F22_016116 [Rhizopus arrhizus]KAG0930903.1 hypothetical protein G6F31_016914 [Rhizopus arrhizus]